MCERTCSAIFPVTSRRSANAWSSMAAIGWAAAVLVLLVFAVISVLLPHGAPAGQIGLADQLSFFVFGLLLDVAEALARP